MRRTLVGGFAVAALACALAPSASAHKKTYPTSVTAVKQIVPGTDNAQATYSGKVTSSNPRCVGGRTVTIGGDGGALGSTTTDASGAFSTGPLSSTASGLGPTTKTLLKNKKHKHVCKFAAFYF